MTTLVQQLSAQFPAQQWPLFAKAQATAEQATLELVIHPDICWFEGHFPEQPVLAGVVQTHWVGCLAQQLFELGESFQRLDNLKFQRVIIPKQTLTLELHYNRSKQSVKFHYRDALHSYSTGTMVF